jgi:hypothetical protein
MLTIHSSVLLDLIFRTRTYHIVDYAKRLLLRQVLREVWVVLGLSENKRFSQVHVVGSDRRSSTLRTRNTTKELCILR